MLERHRIVLAFLRALCAGIVASVASVHAAPDPPEGARRRARALADQGADAYAARDFERARERFVRAYELIPAPTIALLEARTLVELRRWTEARAAYQRAASAVLAADAPAAFRSATRDASTELVALEARMPRYRVVVSGAEPRSLRISLDGELVPPATFGTWTLADPGFHELAVQMEGVARSLTKFELREGDRKTLSVEGGSPADSARTWGMVSLGAGAAGLALGISTGIVAVNAHGDAERLCPDGTCARGSAGADAVQKFETFRTISTLGYALGAAGVGTGVVLLSLGTGSEKPRVALLSRFQALELRGRF